MRNSPHLENISSFAITGLSTRTANSAERDSDTAKIPGLWQDFYASELASNNQPIFGVYANYASDENGEFNVTAGVNSSDTSSEFNSVIIPSGDYLVFHGKGPMPLTVIETWQQIWNFFNKSESYQRKFSCDFEKYVGLDEVFIYIGV